MLPLVLIQFGQKCPVEITSRLIESFYTVCFWSKTLYIGDKWPFFHKPWNQALVYKKCLVPVPWNRVINFTSPRICCKPSPLIFMTIKIHNIHIQYAGHQNAFLIYMIVIVFQ